MRQRRRGARFSAHAVCSPQQGATVGASVATRCKGSGRRSCYRRTRARPRVATPAALWWSKQSTSRTHLEDHQHASALPVARTTASHTAPSPRARRPRRPTPQATGGGLAGKASKVVCPWRPSVHGVHGVHGVQGVHGGALKRRSAPRGLLADSRRRATATLQRREGVRCAERRGSYWAVLGVLGVPWRSLAKEPLKPAPDAEPAVRRRSLPARSTSPHPS